MPALMFGDVSGNHINPAFTVVLRFAGIFSWVAVPGYLIAQLLGAFRWSSLIVVWVHQPYYLQTENPNNILGTFSTISAVDDNSGSEEITNVLGLMVLQTSSLVHLSCSSVRLL